MAGRRRWLQRRARGATDRGVAAGTSGTVGIAGTGGQFIGSSGCALFTPDDVWNADVSGRAVDATNTAKMNALLGAVNIHPDFGPGFGIPINVVPASQAKVPITFDQYADESDPGPYPFPGPGDGHASREPTIPTNCDGDCHVIVVQQGTCQALRRATRATTPAAAGSAATAPTGI